MKAFTARRSIVHQLLTDIADRGGSMGGSLLSLGKDLPLKISGNNLQMHNSKGRFWKETKSMKKISWTISFSINDTDQSDEDSD